MTWCGDNEMTCWQDMSLIGHFGTSSLTNIAGEMSWAVPSFKIFHYFHFFKYFHFFDNRQSLSFCESSTFSVKRPQMLWNSLWYFLQSLIIAYNDSLQSLGSSTFFVKRYSLGKSPQNPPKKWLRLPNSFLEGSNIYSQKNRSNLVYGGLRTHGTRRWGIFLQ